jgi:FemAB-related protein (PEP-CTERM system-associated)
MESLVEIPMSVPTPKLDVPAAVEIAPLAPGEDAARDDFVRAHPRATFFHLAGWRRVVEQVMGHEPADLVARRDGRIVGVLPLMRAPRLITGGALISIPYAVYGGPVGADAEVEHALVRSAMAQAERERCGRLELRCQEDPGVELTHSELYATFVSDLPPTVEGVLARMPKKARAEARKAREKHALTLTEGPWYFEDFHRLFHRNKRSLGSPGLPHAFFWGLRKEFGDAVRIHVVHQRSEVVAAVMSFVWRDELLAYYSGAADGADRQWSASNFMYMALQEWAVAQGLKRFDFGRSRKDSGAFQFKEHQGFAARDLEYRFHLVRDRGLPSLNPSNPKTKWLRDTWAKLPLSVSMALSSELSRYLP